MNQDPEYIRDIETAVSVMKNGGIIAYPTDTVWGIGCDATNDAAVKRIYEIKRRSDSKALITLVPDEEMLQRHIDGCVPSVCREMLQSSDRPTTVVYPRGRELAPSLLAGDGSVGIRITRNGFPGDLCRTMGCPVVSTSANISGEPAASVFSEISPEILDAVDYVALTGRDADSPSRPSRVVKITDGGDVIILRD